MFWQQQLSIIYLHEAHANNTNAKRTTGCQIISRTKNTCGFFNVWNWINNSLFVTNQTENSKEYETLRAFVEVAPGNEKPDRTGAVETKYMSLYVDDDYDDEVACLAVASIINVYNTSDPSTVLLLTPTLLRMLNATETKACFHRDKKGARLVVSWRPVQVANDDNN